MQITKALLSEPEEIRRFVQQAVDHSATSAGISFHAPFGRRYINGQQIQAFCTSFYERITERNHTASPSSPVVLRWLREQHEGATMRCLLLLSQASSICHPRASVTVDEACSRGGFTATGLAGDKRWRTIPWKGVFGLSGLIHQSNTLR